MVDNGENFRFLQTGDGLGSLVVVNQNHLLAPGAEQMIPGQNANDLLVAVQNGIAGMTVFQHHIPHGIHPVIQMEADHVLGIADPLHRDGLENQPRRPEGVVGGGDDAGFRGHGAQFLGNFRLTQHQTADVQLQRPADHVRLVAAQHDALPGMEQQVLPALGQGDGDLPGDGVGVFPRVVENFALQDGDGVEQRHFLQHAGIGAGHVVVRNVRPGQNAVQRAVLVDHGNGGDGGVGLKFVPGAPHGHTAA